MSRQSAEDFSQKIALIQRQGESHARSASARAARALTEDELNSWFLYRAQPVLPAGVSQPQITIVGEGRLAGQAIDRPRRRRETAVAGGGAFDPLSLIGGKVPVTVTGILHTRDGKARFEVHGREMSGIPVPVTVLQEVLTYYSRSDERPQGVRLDDTSRCPRTSGRSKWARPGGRRPVRHKSQSTSHKAQVTRHDSALSFLLVPCALSLVP